MKDRGREPDRVPGPDDKIVDDGSRGIFRFIRWFFWGVDKVQPCFLGAQNTYVDHWLVGPHSWKPQPC